MQSWNISSQGKVGGQYRTSYCGNLGPGPCCRPMSTSGRFSAEIMLSHGLSLITKSIKEHLWSFSGYHWIMKWHLIKRKLKIFITNHMIVLRYRREIPEPHLRVLTNTNKNTHFIRYDRVLKLINFDVEKVPALFYRVAYLCIIQQFWKDNARTINPVSPGPYKYTTQTSWLITTISDLHKVLTDVELEPTTFNTVESDATA